MYLSRKNFPSFSFLEKKLNIDLLYLPSFYYMNKTHRILRPHGRVNKESTRFHLSSHKEFLLMGFS